MRFATTVEGGVIVGVGVANEGVDSGQMEPMPDKVEELCGTRPARRLADGGFASREAVGRVEASGTKVYAPVPEEEKEAAKGIDPFAPRPGGRGRNGGATGADGDRGREGDLPETGADGGVGQRPDEEHGPAAVPGARPGEGHVVDAPARAGAQFQPAAVGDGRGKSVKAGPGAAGGPKAACRKPPGSEIRPRKWNCGERNRIVGRRKKRNRPNGRVTDCSPETEKASTSRPRSEKATGYALREALKLTARSINAKWRQASRPAGKAFRTGREACPH